MSPYEMQAMVSGLSGIGATFFAFFIAVVLGNLLLPFAMRWFIFTKAGEKGWKSLIPFYSDYITYKIAWDGRIYVAIVVATAASFVINFIFGLIHFGLGMFTSLVCFVPLMLANVVAGMVLQFKLARSFGQTDFFAVGMYFLGSVFSAILAFGSAKYKGPQLDDGFGVPSFIANMGNKAAAVAANAAANAAQQLQRQAAQQQQYAQQQAYAQQQYQQGGNAATSRQQAYQQQMQAYQQQMQAYQQAQQQRAGRRANANYDQYNQQ